MEHHWVRILEGIKGQHKYEGIGNFKTLNFVVWKYDAEENNLMPQ